MTQNMDDDFAVHPADNRPFQDVVDARYSRRGVIAGGAATMAATFFAGTGVAEAGGRGGGYGGGRGGHGGRRGGRNRDDIDFSPVPNEAASGPLPSISDDYEYSVLIPWGTPLQPGGPEWTAPPVSAAVAEQQIGIGHDGMWLFPTGRNEGILCINHEFGTTAHVFDRTGEDDAGPFSLEEVRIMQAVHGVSVVEVAKRGEEWERVGSSKNRRITVNTPVRVSGPVADSDLLKNPAGNAPAGTVNNCANGYTPWGTYLTCEENFNGYFGSTEGDAFDPTDEQARYGLSAGGFGYRWHEYDPRFDLSNPDYVNESNRFGWIVEIDPMDPSSKPAKRTALGRFKHEGIALAIGRGGRAVGYMGDDERFDYIYKFVSDKNHRSMLARGKSPLDEGRLYVARFNDDGSGDWLELTIDNPDLAARFESQDEVLTYARIAADILGATPMDRPEWTTVGPNGDVFCTLTNNTRRTVPNAPNPLAPNPDGHIIRWRDADRHVGTTFEWDIVLFAEDSLGTEYKFSAPDGLWADPDGRLFIETDGGQPDGINNQLLIYNDSGVIKRLFSGVTDDEITGVAVTPDRRTLFVNTQHPGDGDPTATNFPAPLDGTTVPRDCTIVIRRKDGGIVGS